MAELGVAAFSGDGMHFESVPVKGVKVIPLSPSMRPVEKVFTANAASAIGFDEAASTVVGEFKSWLAKETAGGKSVAWRVAPEIRRRYRRDGFTEVAIYVRAAFV